MENCVRDASKDRIEFHFYGLNASASGLRTPWILAALVALAILAIVFLATKAGGILFASAWVARIRGP
jgi:hypothetical protein